MKAKEMLEHYKLHGERVDEVLYQTVMGELDAAQITQPCFDCGQQVDEPLYQNDRQDGSLCESCCKK